VATLLGAGQITRGVDALIARGTRHDFINAKTAKAVSMAHKGGRMAFPNEHRRNRGGAILRFAVSVTTTGFNLHTIGSS